MGRYAKDQGNEEARELSNKFTRSNRGLWTFDDYPMLKDWLEENTAGIDLLGEAVRKPAFRIPYTRENENVPIHDACLFLNEIQMMRVWARAVQARAYYRLGIGDIDGAIDDKMTVLHLGRHAGKQGTLSVALFGIAIEGVGYAIGIGSNPEFPPTKEQIERLVTELDALPPRMILNETLKTERLFGLAGFQDIYWGNVGDPPLDPYWARSVLGKLLPHMGWSFDITVLLERANQIYDVMIMIAEGKTIEGRELEDNLKLSSRNPLAFLFARSRTIRFVDQISTIPSVGVGVMQETWHRAECTDNLQRLTIALLLYEQEHGKMPEGNEDDDWREAIRPYLGADADKYFRCPSYPELAEGETTYAMIRRESGEIAVPAPNTLLLVEVHPPMKLFGEGNGTISAATARLGINRRDDARQFLEGIGSYHSGGVNTGLRSGGVSFHTESMSPEYLQQLTSK